MAKTHDVPWLDDDEKGVWFNLVGVFMRLPGAFDAQLRRDAGLSHFEYLILAGLSMTDSWTMRMSDIALFSESTLSRLSHASRRLEEQGLLTRCTDPVDGRATVATLTKAGYAKVVDAAPGHVRTVRALVFDPLTRAQVKQLGEITSRIDAAIGPRSLKPPR